MSDAASAIARAVEAIVDNGCSENLFCKQLPDCLYFAERPAAF
jgi:hypothetical protein